MSTPTNIETLRGLVATLDERSREFASSLISQFDTRGTLSPRQWPWVDTLIERAGEAKHVAQRALQRACPSCQSLARKLEGHRVTPPRRALRVPGEEPAPGSVGARPTR